MNMRSGAKPILVIPLALLLTTCSTVPDKRFPALTTSPAPTPADINHALAALANMLATAGGVSEKAGTQVHIYRQSLQGRESYIIDLLVLASLTDASNAGLITMPVQAGDVINVPPAGTFFVDGAVKTPGPYPLGRRYSLTQALATAGGVDRELYSSDITIFRRKRASEIETILVDFDAILTGSAADPQIEADDVIVVPMSAAKYLVKRFVGQLIAGGISLGSFIPAAGS